MACYDYPNHFRRDCLVKDLHECAAAFADVTKAVAGRLMRVNNMGKSIFADLLDMSGTIQLFVKIADGAAGSGVNAQTFAAFKQWRRGDIIGVSGVLMKTQTGVLSIRVSSACMLTKAQRPLPEKFHGLHDVEQRYRRRYLDLITNETVRTVFQARSKIISYTRRYFDEHGFCEVETPMMHPQVGGAKARPFKTHHNALAMDLYLRIAPELYLKQLVTGGIEKVYEINRSFRNEGISTQHNPEFTMLEFYEAYNDCAGLMIFIEKFLRKLAAAFYRPRPYPARFDEPFRRVRLSEAIVQYCDELRSKDLTDRKTLADYIETRFNTVVRDTDDSGKLMVEIFEKAVEKQLQQPTFITHYPVSVSPLARCNDADADFVDRFELFIDGKEIANGFSELNDPAEQRRRFTHQAREKAAGDAEAMDFDEDYIVALEYGMPPTAGAGIGIDRLVMLMTAAVSIRDVILFPQMKRKDAAP